MDFEHVLVVGAGQMGGGIAQVVAASGRRVSLHDAAPGATERGIESMRRSLEKLAEKDGANPDEVLARVNPVDDLMPADLLIEAVIEDADVKQDVFRRADELLPPEAILASNTSSIPITSLAAVTSRPDRVIGMHFFNPVPVLKLVEIVRGRETSDETAAAIVALAEELGKTPAVANDFPGFVSNRILMPFINEAVWALHDGVAEPEAIDTIAKLGFAHPIGPLVIEELSRGDAGAGVPVAVHTSAVTLPLLRFGTEEQRARFVPPLARGELIGAFALTEAEAGSDAGALRTSGTREDGGWHIAGVKQFISTAEYAGTFLLFARTDPDTPGARGVSAFVLDADQIRVTGSEEKLGLNSSTTHSIAVDTHADTDRLLHEEGKGFHVAMATLDGGRIGIAAQAVGIAHAAYDVAREYAKERHAFGRPIAEFQAIQHKLADMATEIDAARLLVHRAAWLKQNDLPHIEAGAKAKPFAPEMARRPTGGADQILCGYGDTKEIPVARYYLDPQTTKAA